MLDCSQNAALGPAVQSPPTVSTCANALEDVPMIAVKTSAETAIKFAMPAIIGKESGFRNDVGNDVELFGEEKKLWGMFLFSIKSLARGFFALL